jgi:hypothetical protein
LTPLNPAANSPITDPRASPGYDDESNFTGSLVGVGQD